MLLMSPKKVGHGSSGFTIRQVLAGSDFRAASATGAEGLRWPPRRTEGQRRHQLRHLHLEGRCGLDEASRVGWFSGRTSRPVYDVPRLVGAGAGWRAKWRAGLCFLRRVSSWGRPIQVAGEVPAFLEWMACEKEKKAAFPGLATPRAPKGKASARSTFDPQHDLPPPTRSDASSRCDEEERSAKQHKRRPTNVWCLVHSSRAAGG